MAKALTHVHSAVTRRGISERLDESDGEDRFLVVGVRPLAPHSEKGEEKRAINGFSVHNDVCL